MKVKVILGLAALSVVAEHALAQNRIYVNIATQQGGDGSSWTAAFRDLQDALDEATQTPGSDEVWIAKGIYLPDRGTRDRGRSFALTSQLSLHGGFSGGESSLDQADPVRNLTILSGDLARNDIAGFVRISENALHVVVATDVLDVTLDGLTVTGGNADSFSEPDRNGAGFRAEDCALILTRCVLKSNWSRDSGGAMYATGCDLSISGATVTQNTDSFGDYAACMIENSTVTIDDSDFSDNRGGGLSCNGTQSTISDCTFRGNSATALVAGGQDTHITRCQFINNRAESGAAANLFGTPLVTCTDCLFLWNESVGNGGAVYAAHADVVNCVFAGNLSGDLGGALYSGFGVDVIDSVFAGNQGQGMGGAVYAASLSQFTNCEFVSNTAADGRGGAVAAIGDGTNVATFTNCAFSENLAEDVGGAVVAAGAQSFLRCTFEKNVAYDGGGAAYGNSNAAGLRFLDCTFTSNDAGGDGGALALFDSTIDGCVFDANRATGNGGGIVLGGNGIVTLSNSRFCGNRAASGSAIDNAQCDLYASNLIITGNTASNAGALRHGSRFLRLTNSTIASNSASLQTGGIYLLGSPYNDIVANCILWDNSRGGTIDEAAQFVSTDSSYTLSYCDVRDWQGTLGGFGGQGCFSAAPSFADQNGPDGLNGTPDDDLRLTDGSCCIDSGDNDNVFGPTSDFLGLPRQVNDTGVPDLGHGTAPVVDLGATEHQTRSEGIVLVRPIPGVAGQSNRIDAYGLVPGARTQFTYSFTPGRTNVPSCPGVYLSMDSPKTAGRVNADQSGHAALNVFIPSSVPNRVVLIQCLDKSECEVSNLVQTTLIHP